MNKEKAIFVIDDEKDLLELLALYFEDNGHKIVVFENSQDLERSFEKNDPIAIVTDLIIPNDSGLEIIKNIRKTNTKVPIYVISGYPAIHNKSEFEELGVTAIISKPFNMNDFAKQVLDDTKVLI
jgi:DNA-binding NtrC family response regulator